MNCVNDAPEEHLPAAEHWIKGHEQLFPSEHVHQCESYLPAEKSTYTHSPGSSCPVGSIKHNYKELL